jgi:hypothetical protein
MMHTLEQISFHGDLLWAGRDDGDVLVAVKPICLNLTLQWNGQLERIKRDAILSQGMRVIRIPSPGGDQETVCLTLPLVAGWLFGIDDRRIRDETIRAKVLDYKRECHDVLYRHFIGSRNSCDTNALDEDEEGKIAPLGSQQWLVEIALVREARRIHGVEAARALWHQLGLPAVPEMFPAVAASLGLSGDEPGVEQFFDQRCLDAAGSRTRLIDLWQAYVAWCAPLGLSPVCMQTFGKSCRQRWRRLKSSVTWYVGVSLRSAASPPAGDGGTATLN